LRQSWLLERMSGWGQRAALVGERWSARYEDLLGGMTEWCERLNHAGIGPGMVVAFSGDCCDRTVSLLLALIELRCISVPLASVVEAQRAEFLEIAQAEYVVDCLANGPGAIARRGERPGHPLIEAVVAAGHAGLVLFSSGSTGRPKAILHDFDKLLQKFEPRRQGYRILSFLLLDHIGGINTLFYGLSQGGTVVSIRDRRPASICRAIEQHRVEVLPTSPTFLNLLLLSEEHRRHDLSSLRLITYGTEVMPASTLERLHQEFPEVRLQQTYGLSELGILRSKSRGDGSLWIKVGGEGYETKVVDGVLWVRAEMAMCGYLNSESPFDANGWFNTQDAVEEDGEWLRFLGRTTDLINVGGQKVYPAEVESALLAMDNVKAVTVRGERNPIVGQCVVARVRLCETESVSDFKARMRRHCRGILAPYMVPVKVEIAADELHNARFKMIRVTS